MIKAFKSELERPISRVTVEQTGPISMALQCRHCAEPLCAYSCLTGALVRKGGVVEHNPDKCIGCWTCVAVCPYGALKVDVKAKKVSGKCDLCPHLDTPACVANCPNEALVYE
jgi:carbon-monoxide dehydrogenase iron sulfur subunit